MTGFGMCDIRDIRPIECERIGEVCVEAAWIVRADRVEDRAAALVAFDDGDALGTFEKQRARQSTGAGADLDGRSAGEGAGRARNPPRQIEIEEEILAEPLVGGEISVADHIAKRRQAIGTGAGGSRRSSHPPEASYNTRSRLGGCGPVRSGGEARHRYSICASWRRSRR